MSGYQTKGLLPGPLPKYKIKTMEYVIGYSLWLIVLASLLYFGVKNMIKKKKIPETEA